MAKFVCCPLVLLPVVFTRLTTLVGETIGDITEASKTWIMAGIYEDF